MGPMACNNANVPAVVYRGQGTRRGYLTIGPLCGMCQGPWVNAPHGAPYKRVQMSPLPVHTTMLRRAHTSSQAN